MRGRLFTQHDGPGAQPVVVINASAARRYWPGADPIVRRLKPARRDVDAPWHTVVGVVSDMAEPTTR